MRSLSRMVRTLIGLVIGSTISADYWEYSRQYHANPNIWTDVLQGTAAAPQQYRIAIPKLAEFLQNYGHMGLRHAFTLIDFLGALIAAYLLDALFERSAVFQGSKETTRWFGAAAFVFLLQFYFAWITWYQRPETMASAAVLAATLWCLALPFSNTQLGTRVLSVMAMLALAAIQGFIRPDVIVALHLGVLVVCTKRTTGFVLPRTLQALTSVASILVAVAIQYYLMHVAYPQATYRNTPVFELKQNITNLPGWIPFVIFIFPFAWLVTAILRTQIQIDAPSRSLVIGAVIYVALWFLIGRIEEVRIFLPYAVALIPFTCIVAMQQLDRQPQSISQT